MTPEQIEAAEREDAARLLPPAPLPGLTPERLGVRRQHLLDEIDLQARAGAGRRSRGFRWRIVPAAVAGAAAITAVIVTSQGGGDAGGTIPPASAASVRLLDRAALVAAEQPAPMARPGQYTYVKVVGFSTVLSEGKDGSMRRLRQDEAMEQWTSVDGSKRTLQRKGSDDALLPDLPGGGNLNSPTYDFLAALPTDPAALLKTIYRQADEEHGVGSGSTTGPDQEAFVTIGDLLRGQAAPPAIASALYRAAARIPGVVTVPGTVDAAGRQGVAVAREHDGERTEWIFDQKTARFLGERTVQVKDSAWGKAGSPVTSTAVVASGVVDQAGQEP